MEAVHSHWSRSRWRALNPAIYLISILPVFVCALASRGNLPLSYYGWVGLAVVLIQHAINVFNDETDWKKGADIEKKDSWFHFHRENSKALKTHAWLSLSLGLGLGIGLVLKMGQFEVLWVALPLVALGLLYNHPRWTLSYSHWGEWVTAICYGPGVFGCMFYLIHHRASLDLALGSLAFSLLSVGVLLSHQPAQVLTDFAAGKQSFAVRHGAAKTYQVARIFTQLSILSLSLLLLRKQFWENVNLVNLGISLWLGLSLPRQLTPALILKTVSLQIALLGILLNQRWL